MKVKILSLLPALLLFSCVTTLKGPFIGSYRYGGTSVSLMDSYELPFVKKGKDLFIKLKINNQEGIYLISPTELFSMVDVNSSLLGLAFDPKTNVSYKDQNLSWDAAGFSSIDFGFFKADNFLMGIYRRDKMSFPRGPEGPVDGVLGQEIFSGFILTVDPDKSLLILNKGNAPVIKVDPRVKFSVYLSETSKEMDAKILATYFTPQFFASPETYSPPRMFVSLIGFSIKTGIYKKTTEGLGYKQYDMTLDNAFGIQNYVRSEYKIPISRLVAGDNIYADVTRKAIMDSKIPKGWVRILSLQVDQEELIFEMAVSAGKPERP